MVKTKSTVKTKFITKTEFKFRTKFVFKTKSLAKTKSMVQPNFMVKTKSGAEKPETINLIPISMLNPFLTYFYANEVTLKRIRQITRFIFVLSLD